MQLFVFESPRKMWEFAIKRWEEASTYAISTKGKFTVALCGGKTPVGLYKALARRKELPWEKTHIFQTDERFVPHSSAESNFKIIKKHIIDTFDLKKRQVHNIDVEAKSPHNAAMEYDARLRKFFKTGSIPQIDLVLLGIGSDGHTASLFPGDKALEERRKAAISVSGKGIKPDRVTLTLPVLNNAQNALFIVKGKDKADIVRRIMEKSDASMPPLMIVPRSGSADLLVDQEAAGY